MCNSIEKTRRDLFNVWAESEGWESTHTMYYELWLAFNAALDVIEIELPVLKNSTSYYDGGDVHDSAINQCRYNIESLNLGIKIK